MLGTELVAKSPGDGYTIILSDMPHTINPSIYAKVPYDPVKDFTPVTLVGTSAMFLFVNPSTPFQTVKDLIAAAKAAPGKFAIGSGGNGTTTHLSAEIFMQRAGIQLTHVPYKGAGPAMTEVIAGQIPMTFTSMATAAPHVKSGKVRTLGVTARKRVPSYPDIPTFQEAGVSDFIVEHWWGVLAPAGVSKPVLDTLRGALVKVITSSDTRERFAVLAVEPTTNTPDEFRKLLASDVQHWAKVVKAAGIQPN
jgi:tripartite-type tricarboxylate transporter receptor subunit TctC